jgi:hypothetical protein
MSGLIPKVESDSSNERDRATFYNLLEQTRKTQSAHSVNNSQMEVLRQHGRRPDTARMLAFRIGHKVGLAWLTISAARSWARTSG